ncbi:hypothetical protein CFC21_031839 [Triticum aestivum]|uniref:Uncharacterized protein n=5 Tax=Triticinae TaxID=1648030 RepID=A0A9R1EXH4_WHEAT|nr:uncharacterized protein LOC109750924 isoform X1 [Aegilops tauschii subsp. strangulata]XP_020165436.1 uncharacterized protein LOC109750924 isoform X1 [Aegilops tauschii subsp. strangulata]XP_044334402.1 uncharacterized protein LOC123054659 isoform X1 [Triticum aestivum]XP_044334403.1 uncharacterized protein LOC123054659 isoform X1 [Triticum aestivum]KAF7018556.1 hypothetical protein CFC21_031838 [Triticum aestivum]KAF7018558.1 hypothetical protein CFC21_031839 [Triticum aestivum]
MTSEGNKAAAPNEPLPIEPLTSSGAKRKRGRPRKYEYSTYEQPHMAQPIQSIPPLRSALYNPNIRHDGVHINHTLGGTLDTKMHTVYVLPAQQTQGDRPSRPVESGSTIKFRENQVSSSSSAHVQGNLGKDVIIGKHFVGKMTKQCPGFSLITVRVKDNQVLRGWIPDETNLRPITPKDDLAPDLPMLQPSKLQKKASAIHRQAAPPLPVHLENVTIAKPLQMRRPVETSTAKHIIPPAPRPYVGSGVVAAAPVSVISGNVSKPLPKQDTGSLSQEASATVVPVTVKPAQPVLVSCRHVDQDVHVEGKSVPEFNSDSESSSGSKESSGQTPRDFPAAMGETEITSGSKEHSNTANSDQHICKEPSDNPEQSDEPKTETSILKGVDGSMTEASGTTPAAEASSATPNPLDDVQSAVKEDELKVDSKESRLTMTT